MSENRPNRKTSPPILLRPDRVRKIDSRGFAFIPNAFLRDGFFAQLTSSERSLYMLYVLAGDRNGLSYLGHEQICLLLNETVEAYMSARQSLVAKDLLAVSPIGTRVQVLSLPSVHPESSKAPPKRNQDPAYEYGVDRLREILRDLSR